MDQKPNLSDLLALTVSEQQKKLRKKNKQQATKSTTTKTAADTTTTANPHQQQQILPEQQYTDAMERIIQRDFFPGLPKLRAQLAYMEAMESGDFHAMREISLGAVGTSHARANTIPVAQQVGHHHQQQQQQQYAGGMQRSFVRGYSSPPPPPSLLLNFPSYHYHYQYYNSP